MALCRLGIVLPEFTPGGLIDEATNIKKNLAWLPAINDLNEGILGSFCQFMYFNPSTTLLMFNLQTMFQHNDTQNFIYALFGRFGAALLPNLAWRQSVRLLSPTEVKHTLLTAKVITAMAEKSDLWVPHQASNCTPTLWAAFKCTQPASTSKLHLLRLFLVEVSQIWRERACSRWTSSNFPMHPAVA